MCSLSSVAVCLGRSSQTIQCPCLVFVLLSRITSHKTLSFSRGTYARELGAAVTALGDSASLLDVKQTDITTGSLDDSGSVGGGVVAVQQIVSYCRGPKYTARRFDFERAEAGTCPLRRRY
jgi:hypothetical protein